MSIVCDRQAFHSSLRSPSPPDLTKLCESEFESLPEVDALVSISAVTVPDQVKRILCAFANSPGDRSSLPPGCVGLASLLFAELESEHKAFDVFWTLHVLLHKDQSARHQLRSHTLTLSSVLWSTARPLCQHFNTLDFDVVDLSNIVAVWCLPVFAEHFPAPFAKHAVQKTLQHGITALFAIVHSALVSFSAELCACKTDSDVFAVLETVPGRCTEWPSKADSEIDAYLKHQQVTAGQPGSGEWDRAMQVPGSIQFCDSADRQHDDKRSALERVSAVNFRSLAATDASHSRHSAGSAQLHIISAQSAKPLPSSPAQASTAKPNNQSNQTAVPPPPSPAPPVSPPVSAPPPNKRSSGKEPESLMRIKEFSESWSKALMKLQLPCIFMNGYLLKMGRPSVFGRQSLHRRWFVLKGRFLTYFRHHSDTKPTVDRCFDVHGRQVCKLDNHRKGDLAIEISGSGSAHPPFVLFATSTAERDAWVSALHAAAQL